MEVQGPNPIPFDLFFLHYRVVLLLKYRFIQQLFLLSMMHLHVNRLNTVHAIFGCGRRPLQITQQLTEFYSHVNYFKDIYIYLDLSASGAKFIVTYHLLRHRWYFCCIFPFEQERRQNRSNFMHETRSLGYHFDTGISKRSCISGFTMGQITGQIFFRSCGHAIFGCGRRPLQITQQHSEFCSHVKYFKDIHTYLALSASGAKFIVTFHLLRHRGYFWYMQKTQQEKTRTWILDHDNHVLH